MAVIDLNIPFCVLAPRRRERYVVRACQVFFCSLYWPLGRFVNSVPYVLYVLCEVFNNK